MTALDEGKIGGLGASRQRVEDARFIRGRGHYVDDIHLPGMLHMEILRSPLAHARIVAIDTSKAWEIPGVRLVLTGEMMAQRNLAWVPSDNPGGPETRTIQHSFAIKAPPRDLQRLRPDRLIIDWGGLPPGCRMRLYMPDVDAIEVLRLAVATQDYPGLAGLEQ